MVHGLPGHKTQVAIEENSWSAKPLHPLAFMFDMCTNSVVDSFEYITIDSSQIRVRYPSLCICRLKNTIGFISNYLKELV